jgi:hypothetical protein
VTAHYSTCAVGAEHRGVMRDGKVFAVADSTEDAALIVRALNEMDSYEPAEWGRGVLAEKNTLWMDNLTSVVKNFPAGKSDRGPWRQLYVRRKKA